MSGDQHGHGHAHGRDHDHHDHGHHHGHGHHGHGHGGHSHAPANFGRAFAIGIALNVGFVVVEAVYGWLADSMALLADAGHNLSDVFGLLIAWGASVLARKQPKGRYTYGLRSSSILAAFVNALMLLIATALIVVEAVRHLFDPEPVKAVTIMVVAAIGIAINTGTALMFMGGRHDDINIRGAFLHMAADAAVSAGVVIAGLVILYTGWNWIDPAVSLAISVVIAVGTWALLRESVDMSLQAVPAGIDLTEIEALFGRQPGVAAIHDLHVWSMSTTEIALTAHLLMPGGYPGDAFTAGLATELQKRFRIGHSTIQIETDPEADCLLAPAGTV